MRGEVFAVRKMQAKKKGPIEGPFFIQLALHAWSPDPGTSTCRA